MLAKPLFVVACVVGQFMLPPDVALWNGNDDYEAPEVDPRQYVEPELLMAEQA